MVKKIVPLMPILLSLSLLLYGCLMTKVKLDYIEVPDEMTMHGYNNMEKINELNTKLSDMKEKGASREEQNEVMQEIGKLENESTLRIKDAEFINKVMNEIVYSEGILQGSSVYIPQSDKTLFDISFPFKQSQKEVNDNSEGTVYTNDILIFTDGTVLIHSYDKNSPPNMIAVKGKLNSDVVKYIEAKAYSFAKPNLDKF